MIEWRWRLETFISIFPWVLHLCLKFHLNPLHEPRDQFYQGLGVVSAWCLRATDWFGGPHIDWLGAFILWHQTRKWCWWVLCVSCAHLDWFSGVTLWPPNQSLVFTEWFSSCWVHRLVRWHLHWLIRCKLLHPPNQCAMHVFVLCFHSPLDLSYVLPLACLSQFLGLVAHCCYIILTLLEHRGAWVLNLGHKPSCSSLENFLLVPIHPSLVAFSVPHINARFPVVIVHLFMVKQIVTISLFNMCNEDQDVNAQPTIIIFKSMPTNTNKKGPNLCCFRTCATPICSLTGPY